MVSPGFTPTGPGCFFYTGTPDTSLADRLYISVHTADSLVTYELDE